MAPKVLQRQDVTSKITKISEDLTITLPLIINPDVNQQSDGILSVKTNTDLSNSHCRLGAIRIVTICFPVVVIGMTVLIVVAGAFL